MANFDVKTRLDYMDVSGMILALRPQGLVEYPGISKRLLRWTNEAPPTSGARFGNAVPASGVDVDITETPSGPRVDLNVNSLADAQHLEVESIGTFTSSRKWAFAWAWENPNTITGNDQYLWGFGNDDVSAFSRDAASTDYGWQTAASGAVSTSPVRNSQEAFLLADGTSADLFDPLNAALPASLAGAFGLSAPAADASDGLLIGVDANSNYAAMRISHFFVWNRIISPLELDFFFHTFHPLSGASTSQYTRADMELRTWDDATGDIDQNQFRRVNPAYGRPHRFVAAKGLNERVQFVCEVDGVVLPDADLGGDLFSVSVIESAGSTPITVTQDAGWSSVFDIAFPVEGHYTLLFERPNGGGMFVHIDVEST